MAEEVLIDTDVLVRAIHSMADIGVKSVYFAGEGEPLLHKDLGVFVKTAHERGIKVSMSSNASLLTERRIQDFFQYFQKFLTCRNM